MKWMGITGFVMIGCLLTAVAVFAEETPKRAVETVDPGVGDPGVIRTFEDFVKHWRKRVLAHEGSPDALKIYDEAKINPGVEKFDACITQARQDQDVWGEAVCLIDGPLTLYESYTIDLGKSVELRKTWIETGGNLAKDLTGQEAGAYAVSLNHLGRLLLDEKKYDEARSLLEKALSIQENASTKSHSELASIHYHLGLFMSEQGKPDLAYGHYENAMKLWTEADSNHPKIASCWNQFGHIAAAKGEYETAKERFKKAIAILEQNYPSGHPQMIVPLVNLAVRYQVEGENSAAEQVYNQAYKIAEKTLNPDHPYIGVILGNRSAILKSLGNYEDLRKDYERALMIHKKIPNNPRTAVVLNNQSDLLMGLGEYEAAQEKIEEALAIWKATQGDVALALSNLGFVLYHRGKFDLAREKYEQALAIRRKDPSQTYLLARTLDKLGLLLMELNSYETARNYFEEALGILKKDLSSKHIYMADTLSNYGRLLARSANYDQAREKYEEARSIRENVLGADHPYVANSLADLANLSWKRGDLPSTRKYFQNAAEILQCHVEKIFPLLSFAEQRNFLSLYLPEQPGYLLSAFRENDTIDPKAYALLLHWKGLMIESLRRQTEVFNRVKQNSEDQALLTRLRELRVEISHNVYYRNESLPPQEWQAKIKELTDKKEQIERDLSKIIGPDLWNDPVKGTDLATFQNLLADDEAFVDTYRYPYWEKGVFVEERYTAVIVTRNDPPKWVDLGKSDDVDQAIKTWRERVIANQISQSSWENLKKMTWDPLKSKLSVNVNKIWLCPDDALSLIPWHRFPLTKGDLSESKMVLLAQVDSPRQFVKLRQRLPTSFRPSMLLVGDINFGRIQNQCEGINSKPGCFDALQASKSEVLALEKLAKAQSFDRIMLLLGDEPDFKTITSNVSGHSYIHIASHGFFYQGSPIERKNENLLALRGGFESTIPKNARNPLMASGIALSGANLKDEWTFANQGILTAEDIAGLDLSSCRLFTLSACETGLGEVYPGQGVLGFRASIMAAGVQSVLMSLWKVPDEATQELMKRFYSKLLDRENPVKPLQALIQAQKEISEIESYRAPIHWAGWVIVGESW